LAQLGALTRGHRGATGGGLFSAADNLESREAEQALQAFWHSLLSGHLSMPVSEFEQKTGLRLRDKDGNTVSQLPVMKDFLNRLLNMRLEDQDTLFSDYEQILQEIVHHAQESGTLDVGIETIRADHVEKVREETVYTDDHGAEAKYVQLHLKRKTSPASFEKILRRKPTAFVRSSKDNVLAVFPAPARQDDYGRIHERAVLVGPTGTQRYVDADEIYDPTYGGFRNSGYARIEEKGWEAAWNEAVEKAPEFNEEDLHMVTGAIVPIWDRLPKTEVKVKRAQTDTGERIVGRQIRPSELQTTLDRLQVEQGGAQFDPKTGLRDVAEKRISVELANGWTVRGASVGHENRVEILGQDVYLAKRELEIAGAFSEKVNGRVRFFIPTGPAGQAVFESIAQRRPVMKVSRLRTSGSALNPFAGSGKGNSDPRPDALDGIVASIEGADWARSKTVVDALNQIRRVSSDLRAGKDVDLADPDLARAIDTIGRTRRNGGNKPEDPTDKAEREIAEAEVKFVDTRERRVHSLAHWLMSMEALTRTSLDPRAWGLEQRRVVEFVEADLLANHQIHHDTLEYERLKRKVGRSRVRQVQVREAMERLRRGESIAEYSAPVQDAAQGFNRYFDEMREEIKQYKRLEFREAFGKNVMEAITAVQDGNSVEAVAPEHELDPEDLAEMVADYEAIDDWGLEQYVTNVELGEYVLRHEGQPIARGVTRRQAVKKAMKWVEAQGITGPVEFEIDTTGRVERGPAAAYMSAAQRQALQNRLMAEVRDRVAELGEAFDREATKRVVGAVVRVKPTRKWAGPLQRRKGVFSGEENIFDVMPTYIHAVRTKLALDPVIVKFQKEMHRYSPDLRAGIEEMIADTKGGYSKMDELIDPFLEKFGMRQRLWSRVSGRVRSFEAAAKLGYRPVAYVQNLVGARAHTWAMVGGKYMRKGRVFLRTEHGKSLLEVESPYLGISFASSEAHRVFNENPPWWHPLRLHNQPESYSRKLAYAATYLYGREEMNLPDEAARLFARQGLRLQQFTYNTAAMPKLLRGATRRTVFQFKSYLASEAAWVATMYRHQPGVLGRYLLAQSVIFGPRFLIYFLRMLPLIGIFGGWDKLEDGLAGWLGPAYRGLAGMATGADLTPMAVPQVGTKISDAFGPAVSDFWRFGEEVVMPVLRGEEGTLGRNLSRWARRSWLAWNNWEKFHDALMDAEGWIRDARGNKQYQVSDNWDRFLLLSGAKPIGLSDQELAQAEQYRRDQNADAGKAAAIARILEAERDGEDSDRLIEQASERFGVTMREVRAARRRRDRTPQERMEDQRGKRYEEEVGRAFAK
jgi:hypothetical protein